MTAGADAHTGPGDDLSGMSTQSSQIPACADCTDVFVYFPSFPPLYHCSEVTNLSD